MKTTIKKTTIITLTLMLFFVMSGIDSKAITGDLTASFGTNMPAGFYVVPAGNNIYVPAGATFTIDNGVVIKFENTSYLETFAGSRLTIMENTEFRFMTDGSFRINGDFIVEGTPATPVRFKEEPSNIGYSWDGIIFDTCTIDTVIINHAEIMETEKTNWGSFVETSGALCVSNSTFVVFQVNQTMFKHNEVAGFGGGICLSNSGCANGFMINGSRFIENHAHKAGGGIFFKSNFTNFTMVMNNLTGNHARYGGGLFLNNAATGTVDIDNNEFIDNSAYYDGGGCVLTGNVVKLEIIKNLFDHNHANNHDGGGIMFKSFFHVNPIIMLLNTFSYNTARDGAGVCSKNEIGTEKKYLNNLFLHNDASDLGGAIYCEFGYNFLNNTITENTGVIGTGGIYATTNTVGADGIANNILWQNSPTQVCPLLSGGGDYPNFYYSDIENTGMTAIAFANGNINSDPQFNNPATNDYHIQSSSPCIETGEPGFAPNTYFPSWRTDLDMTARIKGTDIDMGAFEIFTKVPIAFGKTKTTAKINQSNTGNTNMSVYPNPAITNVTVSINTGNSTVASIDLVDLNGKTIKKLSTGLLNEGNNIQNFKLNDIKGGIYFIRVIGDDINFVHKLVIQ